jgi:plastocyanin
MSEHARLGGVAAAVAVALAGALVAGGPLALAKVHGGKPTDRTTKVASRAEGRNHGKGKKGRHARRNPYARFLTVDAKTRSVRLELIAADGSAGGGFNFDGGVDGHPVVRVPVGWTVTVAFRNDGSLPHSAAVVANASATKPVFPGAETPNPTTGEPTGQSATFTFRVTHAGHDRIACLVPGHEGAGMWITFLATPGGRPSISP